MSKFGGSGLRLPFLSADCLIQGASGALQHCRLDFYGEKASSKPDSSKLALNIRGGYVVAGKASPLTLDYDGYTFHDVQLVSKYESLDTYRQQLYARLNLTEKLKREKEKSRLWLELLLDAVELVFGIATLGEVSFVVKSLSAIAEVGAARFLVTEGLTYCGEKGLKRLILDYAPTIILDFSKAEMAALPKAIAGPIVEKAVGFTVELNAGEDIDRKRLLALHLFQLRYDPAYQKLYKLHMEAAKAKRESEERRTSWRRGQ